MNNNKLDIEIIQQLLEIINTDLNKFNQFGNKYAKEIININVEYLYKNHFISHDIKFCIGYKILLNNGLHLYPKGVKLLNYINNGIIKNVEDICKLDEGINTVNNNIQVSPNISNIINNQNISTNNITTLTELTSYINNNNAIENKAEILNTIKELEKAKDNNNKEDYIDKLLKLLELLNGILPIPTFIIKAIKIIKNFF